MKNNATPCALPFVTPHDPLLRGGAKKANTDIVFVSPRYIYNHDTELLNAHIYNGVMSPMPYSVQGHTQETNCLIYIPDSLCSETITWIYNLQNPDFFAARPIEVKDVLDIVDGLPLVKTMYLLLDTSWLIR